MSNQPYSQRELLVVPDAGRLRAYYAGLSYPFANPVIYLQGIIAPADGSEGFFEWRSASTEADDNLNTFKPQWVPTAQAGRWARITSNSDDDATAPIQDLFVTASGGTTIRVSAAPVAVTGTATFAAGTATKIAVASTANMTALATMAFIYGVGGTTQVNGLWTVAAIQDSTHFSVPVPFVSAWTSGGTVWFSVYGYTRTDIWRSSMSGPVSDTWDTATNLIASLGGTTTFPGDRYRVIYHNDGDYTVTMLAGTGVTLVNNAAIASGEQAQFIIQVDDVPSSAVTITRITS